MTAATLVLTDWRLLTGRCLRRMLRNPTLLVFAVVQPVLLLLLFRYIFGGAIVVGQVDYASFFLPGILTFTAVFAASTTAFGVAEDAASGFYDRIRSMPTARSASLAARLVSDTVVNAAVLVIMLAVGYAVGFRAHTGFGQVAAMLGLVTLLGVAFACVGAWVGLTVRPSEAVQAACLSWQFPVSFVSSVFVPLASMPGWLRPVAWANPVTQVTAAARGLALGGPVAGHAWASLGWSVGITAVFGSLAIRAYRRR